MLNITHSPIHLHKIRNSLFIHLGGETPHQSFTESCLITFLDHPNHQLGFNFFCYISNKIVSRMHGWSCRLAVILSQPELWHVILSPIIQIILPKEAECHSFSIVINFRSCTDIYGYKEYIQINITCTPHTHIINFTTFFLFPY